MSVNLAKSSNESSSFLSATTTNNENLDFGIMTVDDVYKLAREFVKGIF